MDGCSRVVILYIMENCGQMWSIRP